MDRHVQPATFSIDSVAKNIWVTSILQFSHNVSFAQITRVLFACMSRYSDGFNMNMEQERASYLSSDERS
jgi:hypothetical protein